MTSYNKPHLTYQQQIELLKNRGLIVKDEEFVLSPLFRPSNIGILQDESSVTVADIVTAFKK